MTFLLLLMPVSVAGFLLVLFARARPIFFICLLGYSLVMSQSFPIIYLGDRPVNISTDHVLIAALFGAWLLARMHGSRKQPLPRFVLPYFLFSAWALFSLSLSIFRHGIAAHLPAFIETSKWFMYTLMILLPCLEFIRSDKHAQTVLKHLAFGALIVVIVGYVQWALLPSRVEGNIVSTFGSIAREDIITVKNSFAVYVAMSWLVIVALFLSRRINLRFAGLLLGTFGVLVLWSFSRSAVLGMLVGLVWLIVTKFIKPFLIFRVPRRAGFVVAVIGILVIMAFGYSAVEGFHEHTPVGRIASFFANPSISKGSQGIAVRQKMFAEGVRAFLDHPVVGYGFHARRIELPYLGIVDNFYLDVALDTGLVGLLFMLWLLNSTLASLWRTRHVALQLGVATLSAWTWGAGGALVCLYFSGISGSIPYVDRLLGTVVIVLACLERWRTYLYQQRVWNNPKM